VRGYANQQVELSYSPPRRGKMAAINRAMPQARGEIIVFSDANNEYAPDTLRELVRPFADPTVGAVSGAKTIARGDGALGDSEGLYWKYESFIKQAETRLGSCTGVAGEILALRRELFELPPDNIINDDFYMAMRIIARGHRLVYAPRARSTEHVSASAQDEVARRARIVAGRYQAIALAHRLVPLRRPLVAWQIISHKFLRPLVPLAMFGALLTNVIAVLFPSRRRDQRLQHLAPPVNWLLMLAQVLFYALAWVGNHTERGGTVGKLLYLPTFLVNSNLAAVIGLYRFLSRRQTTLWQRVRRRDPQAARTE
jgi:cellulose synthase/poly-beta-1,6-N-acetylglucosamine synthase-like glycosyltransferase